MSVVDDIPFMEETPEERHAYRFHCGNSQATSEDYSEANDHLEERNREFQNLPQKQAEIRGHKSRAGVFSRLRKKLSFRFGQVPGGSSSSAVRSAHIDSVSAGRNSPIIVHKQRTPCYRCVPNPPGCIPTEMILKVIDGDEPFNSELLNSSGLGEGVIDGAIRSRKVCPLNGLSINESIPVENGDLASNAHIYKDSKPPKVWYNNWIDPEL